MPGFDMHVHTTASDGSLNIKEIISLAMKIGLEGIAITDHDTIGALEEGVTLGKELNYPIIPGIELSTEANNKEFHILGYFVDFNEYWFQEKLHELQNARINRIIKIVDQLKKLGYDVNVKEILELSGSGSVGRPHVAQILHRKGYFTYPQEAFQQLIGRGGKAYVPRYKMAPTEAVNLIKKAGGIPVLAHPGLTKADELIIPLINLGLMGIEVFHPDHKVNDEIKYLNIARKYNLLVTGGSDFHGMLGGNRSSLGTKYVSAAIWQQMLNIKGRVSER